MNKVLIIVAHSDDETLGCGGSIVKHSEKNDQVKVLVLTDSSSAQNKCTQKRKDNFISAISKLGVDEYSYLDYQDNHLDSYPLIKIIQDIEKEKQVFNPNIVYTHSAFDLNIDHQIVNKAVLTAFRPTQNSNIRKIYS